METTEKANSFFTQLLTYILVLLLILGVAGAIIYLIFDAVIPSVYAEYNGISYYSDNDGISIEWEDGAYTAEFSIKSVDGWGDYAVSDSTVKVIPYVTVEDETGSEETKTSDFNFTAGNSTYTYSTILDLSAAFIEDYTSYDGNGLAVDADGNFTLYFDYYFTNTATSMQTALYRVFGDTIELSSVYNISDYAYFALQIIPPDGGTQIIIPFKVNYTGSVYYSVSYDRSTVGGNFSLVNALSGDGVVKYNSNGILAYVKSGYTVTVGMMCFTSKAYNDLIGFVTVGCSCTTVVNEYEPEGTSLTYYYLHLSDIEDNVTIYAWYTGEEYVWG